MLLLIINLGSGAELCEKHNYMLCKIHLLMLKQVVGIITIVSKGYIIFCFITYFVCYCL